MSPIVPYRYPIMQIKEFRESNGLSEKSFKRLTRQVMDQSGLNRDDLIEIRGRKHHIIRVDLFEKAMGKNEVLYADLVEETALSTNVTETRVKAGFDGLATIRNVNSIDYQDMVQGVQDYVGGELEGLQTAVFHNVKNGTTAAVIRGHVAGLLEGQQLAAKIDPNALGKFLESMNGGG